MAAEFRIIPGTGITVAPIKSQFEIGENVIVSVDCQVEGRGLVIGGFWTIYYNVYIFNKKITSPGWQKFNAVGTTDTCICTDFRTNCGPAPSAGTFSGYVSIKAHPGI